MAPATGSTGVVPIWVTDRLPPSTSLSLDSRFVPMVAPASSPTLSASSTAIGAWFAEDTPLMVTTTVAVSVPPLPSLTV